MLLKDLKKIYEGLPLDTTEENIKIKIVIEVLEELGFDKKTFSYEECPNENIKNRRVDISIHINNKNNDMFYVEVKSKNHKLTDKDIEQIVSYLHKKNLEWGLLTNGNHYILVNDKLNTTPSNKKIFDYYLFNVPTEISAKNNNYLITFLNIDSLFTTKITNYCLLWKEFIIATTLTPKSQVQYKSAYDMFIKFIINKYNCYNPNYLNINNFKYFIDAINKEKSNKYKKQSVKSKYRYLLKFSNFLEEERKIAENTFKNFNIDEFINELDLKQKKQDKIENIKPEEINLMLNYFDSRKFATRNKLLFLLVLYGLDFNDIINLKQSHFDFKKNKIIINDRKFPLPDNIKSLVQEIINEKKKNKIKMEYLFFTKYENGYRKVGYALLNDVINRNFNNLPLPKERTLQLNIQFIKSSLIQELYKSGYNIEEISYFTNLSFHTISSYLDEEEVIKRGSHIITKLTNKHPYSKFI